jgi:hypothetical protein
MKQDRFMIVILGVIAVLAVSALALFFLRRGIQTYQPDDTPQGIVHNYILALQKGDYERAYSYMADLDGKPVLASFHQAFTNNRSSIGDTAVQIGEVSIIAKQATVTVALLQSGGGPFSDPSWNNDSATLINQGNRWKISKMPFPFWNYDWYPEKAQQK